MISEINLCKKRLKKSKPINTIKPKEDNSYYRAKEGLDKKNDL
jgi:hypothetical protein